ncbi:hypothetical protein H6G91_01105 [Nostoc muscorum FACHB-395]|jgi:hypothetical protein|uniref:hypothetical protein n=1 Tax=Nostoc sp. C057 TaxID=2576903 RepID=UPI0016888006|nr:hypothetical protein [Nostoc sp. C057]MBD2505882.1 hypothetical protein [Desmonostoc muscorum FACHB-395]
MIVISNLHPNSDVNLLTELTDWEMRTVEGGRRRSRREDEDTSGMLSKDNIKETVNDWLSNIEQQIVDLRQQLTGLQ